MARAPSPRIRQAAACGQPSINRRLRRWLGGLLPQLKALIERSAERGAQIAQQLTRTLVLKGDATDEDLMEQENISEMDLFLALTNDDEDNIMAATLAKRLGCRRVLALINRRAYADMVQDDGCARDSGSGPPPLPAICVRVESDGSVPPLLDPWQAQPGHDEYPLLPCYGEL